VYFRATAADVPLNIAIIITAIVLYVRGSWNGRWIGVFSPY
jgi:hypothetical protein